MDLSKIDPNSKIGTALAIARIASDSNLYKLNVPQATMQILAGAELGLEPVASLRGVHLIKGQTILDYTVLAALVEQSGAYEVETTPILNDETGETIGFKWDRDHCSLDFYKRDAGGGRRLIGRSVFDRKDAELAKLTEKENWKKHPKAMFMARAMSQGVRAHCPAVTMGSAYVPGEIEEPTRLEPQTFDTSPRKPAPLVQTQVSERPAEPETIDVAPRSAPTKQLPRPEVLGRRIATPEQEPLSAKERARAMLDAEDAAAAAAASERPEKPNDFQILVQARASATNLAQHLPPERRGRARAAIDTAIDLVALEKIRRRIEAGIASEEQVDERSEIDLRGLA